MDKDTGCLWLLSAVLVLQKSKGTCSRYQFLSTMTSSSKPKASQSVLKDNVTIDFARCEEAAAAVHSKFSNDSIICYLYAVLMRLQGSASTIGSENVRELLVTSIKLNQYNWAAWCELSTFPMSKIHDDQLKLMEFYQFYTIERCMREKSSLKQVLVTLQDIHRRYPKWTYISVQLGTVLHDLRQFKDSANIFSSIRTQDKFCISGMDVYSNCLYVNEELSSLSELAHFWIETNPNARETNVVAGNYFSLKGDHEKAALFFKRASAIDPSNTNAWLLLGHELIELRNPSAALAAYKSAINSDPKDSRCWYSIGQLFELINQHAFAVYYHSNALELDEKDSRILRALVSCYEKLGRPEESRKCEKRISDMAQAL